MPVGGVGGAGRRRCKAACGLFDGEMSVECDCLKARPRDKVVALHFGSIFSLLTLLIDCNNRAAILWNRLLN